MPVHRYAIVGEQCAGKTSVAEIIKRVLPIIPTPATVKMAQPIYDILRVLGKPKHRLFMQECSDLAKKHFGNDIFLKLFEHNKGFLSSTCQVCDDVRYKFEVDKVREMDFKIIFITAPESKRMARAEAQGLVYNPNHNSETEVDSLRAYADYIIDNRFGLPELEQAVRIMLAGNTQNIEAGEKLNKLASK